MSEGGVLFQKGGKKPRKETPSEAETGRPGDSFPEKNGKKPPQKSALFQSDSGFVVISGGDRGYIDKEGGPTPPRETIETQAPATSRSEPRGLYRTGLPAGGRQWSWSKGDPLERFTLFLPESLMVAARSVKAWRDIPLSAVVRRACEIGMVELQAAIDREDADRASGCAE
jgi:hypothetical protein